MSGVSLWCLRDCMEEDMEEGERGDDDLGGPPDSRDLHCCSECLLYLLACPHSSLCCTDPIAVIAAEPCIFADTSHNLTESTRDMVKKSTDDVKALAAFPTGGDGQVRARCHLGGGMRRDTGSVQPDVATTAPLRSCS